MVTSVFNSTSTAVYEPSPSLTSLTFNIQLSRFYTQKLRWRTRSLRVCNMKEMEERREWATYQTMSIDFEMA